MLYNSLVTTPIIKYIDKFSEMLIIICACKSKYELKIRTHEILMSHFSITIIGTYYLKKRKVLLHLLWMIRGYVQSIYDALIYFSK